eukprot:TRINITY_DN43869_c0_g1_i1.p1 TRINITY_DN43869_c0_g1~~TRINITY_DN43869_c0_g1_i1.p1  ORF type:complete len:359 (+),score=89.70 TRINITY_DN43869_c0_g1_i1:93-1169(+)
MSALFVGSSLLRRSGEAVSVTSELKDKTVIMYFAAGQALSWPTTSLLSMFYTIIRKTDDSVAVVVVLNDNNTEEQLAFFNGEDKQQEWLMVERSDGLQDIMDHFNVEKIPRIVVAGSDGKAVVHDAHEQICELFVDAKGDVISDVGVEAAVAAKWAKWKRLAGDWPASEGHKLVSSSCAVSAAPADGEGSSSPSSKARNDRETLRAARLAAFERSGFGGGVGGAASATISTYMSAGVSSSSASPGQVAAAPAGVPRSSTGAMSSEGGSDTFASHTAGAFVGGGVAYTLAGDEEHEMESDAAAVDPASDVEDDCRDIEVTIEESVAAIVEMGFPESMAREALQASNGDVDMAIASIIGE